MLNDKRDRGYELKPSDRSFSNTLFAGFDRGVAHTFQELYDEASQYGKVKNIRFKPTNPTKFCFVDCLTNEARDKALVALADLKNAGFKVNVSLPAEKEGSESDFERNKRLLYVGRSEPLDMKELSKTLHKTIGPHAILTGQSKLSFGFVHYEVKEDAERAITELDGLSFQGAKMYVEKYIPQEEFNRIKEPFPKENSEF
ncbi:hypothetical protein BC833DRAFT_604952 [Globomyces pollinis-pini]|nr:hypothetical protein BC833DRAFT_604952 [Globomyces pollinis-pini]